MGCLLMASRGCACGPADAVVGCRNACKSCKHQWQQVALQPFVLLHGPHMQKLSLPSSLLVACWLLQSPLAPHEPLLLTPALQQLVLLIQDTPHLAAVAQAAACTIGHCCTSFAEVQQQYVNLSATSHALSSLLHCCTVQLVI
jgi:hypothetical protein